ncbi:hypothetical protein PP939_gp253 [Rhizobium phage RL38J1]|uniref:Uncharacterized protein n=1 Tax=Rhizobium phage RL38J1 TaxID=2663232 RepID=A0A6B9J6Y9_9CAUD|nr:hypothetical protein PP939_gp253 [Rhizobium phage RL38J1]QGZ14021.1 hypothetical protein RL38J1_253 [Rhizobium phage RL38J1]
MTKTNETITRLIGWLNAGDKAEDKYGYHGAGRMPIESDIRVLLEKVETMRIALQTAHTVLDGIMVVRRPGDVLEVIQNALEGDV